ncbi:MAG: hypothetical protein RL339_1880 [Pseudomonadota bacterium]|jgi:hypothetical protein
MTSLSSSSSLDRQCVAFAGGQLISRGALIEVALALRGWDRTDGPQPLILDERTGEPVEVDLRGTPAEVVARLGAASDQATERAPARPGRPKIGVIAREVTLLPRHWEWLAQQPGSASQVLRRLIDAQRGEEREMPLPPELQQNVYRFMSAIAGNFPGFEDVSRALFAGDIEGTIDAARAWPVDVQDHLRRMINRASMAE